MEVGAVKGRGKEEGLGRREISNGGPVSRIFPPVEGWMHCTFIGHWLRILLGPGHDMPLLPASKSTGWR
jgi:hypothetical protein